MKTECFENTSIADISQEVLKLKMASQDPYMMMAEKFNMTRADFKKQFLMLLYSENTTPKTITLDENKILKRIKELEVEIREFESDIENPESYLELGNLEGQRWALKNRKQFEVKE